MIVGTHQRDLNVSVDDAGSIEHPVRSWLDFDVWDVIKDQIGHRIHIFSVHGFDIQNRIDINRRIGGIDVMMAKTPTSMEWSKEPQPPSGKVTT